MDVEEIKRMCPTCRELVAGELDAEAEEAQRRAKEAQRGQRHVTANLLRSWRDLYKRLAKELRL